MLLKIIVSITLDVTPGFKAATVVIWWRLCLYFSQLYFFISLTELSSLSFQHTHIGRFDLGMAAFVLHSSDSADALTDCVWTWAGRRCEHQQSGEWGRLGRGAVTQRVSWTMNSAFRQLILVLHQIRFSHLLYLIFQQVRCHHVKFPSSVHCFWCRNSPAEKKDKMKAPCAAHYCLIQWYATVRCCWSHPLTSMAL